MAHTTSNTEGQRSTSLIKAENKARTVTRVYSPYYAIRDSSPWAPAPEAIMLRADSIRFIEAESEVRTVARVFRPAYATRAAPLSIHAFKSVLETNELLKQILSYILVEYRVRIRRVSKAWKKLLLEIGLHLEPAAPMDRNYSCPTYVTDMGVRYNPIFVDTWAPEPSESIPARELSDSEYIVLAHRQDRNRSTIVQRQQEFIMSPPSTVVSVRLLTDAAEDHYANALLGIHDGIRLGHLVEVLDKMGVHTLTRSAMRTSWWFRNSTDNDIDAIARPCACFSTFITSSWDSSNKETTSLSDFGGSPYGSPEMIQMTSVTKKARMVMGATSSSTIMSRPRFELGLRGSRR